MNTSDQNEFKSDISLEIESIDGDDDLQFEVPHLSEDEIEENIPPSKAMRSKNLEYNFIESFDNKKDLDKFW